MSASKSIWIFILGLVLVIISPHLLSYGMFMDGSIYATVGRNMAEGKGSIWLPFLSETLYPEFYEHPPLSFFIQSLLFRAIGDFIWIEKIYGLSVFILSAFLIHKIWNRLTYNRHEKLSWLPVLLWSITPLVTWSIVNSMLECTLLVFILGAVLSMLKSESNPTLKSFIIPGVLLAAGVLTKGFVGLFVWSFYFWAWLILRNFSLGQGIKNSILIIVFTLVPLVILFGLLPDSLAHFQSYIDKQVVKSIKEVSTVPYRAHILVRLLKELIPMLLLGLVFFFSFRKSATISPDKKRALLMIAIALSGVLPLLITMKQRGFYLLTAFPFFALALSLFVAPHATIFFEKFKERIKLSKAFGIFSALLLCTGLMLSFLSHGTISRDKKKLADVLELNEYFKEPLIIGLSPTLNDDWGLRAYAYRIAHISMDPLKADSHDFLLIPKQEESPEGFINVSLELQEFELLKKE